MASLRAWILTICAACIAAGVLQQLCVQRSGFSVIKLILTLYILITAFAPIRSLQNEKAAFSMPVLSTEVTVPDVKGAAIHTAESTLSKMLESTLSNAGVQSRETQVILQEVNGDLQVEQVNLLLFPGQDEQEARTLVARMFDMDVQLMIREEDSE